MEKKHNQNFNNQGINGEERRIKMPRNGEILGIIDQRVGGSRMIIKCADGKTRNCRVPGRLKRVLWLRDGDLVIIKPWEFDNDKGDIVFKYHPNDANVLKERGLLKELNDSL